MDISCCKKCNLFKNQEPLLDKGNSADIMWIGLSAKKVNDINLDTPLSVNTNSGKLINKIETGLKTYTFAKTNLVKCLPLDEVGKLRYPKQNEMKLCYNNLLFEFNNLNPKMVFLLGQNVTSFIFKQMNVTINNLNYDFNYNYYEEDGRYYVPVHHPSYIYVYKRKQVDHYVFGVQKIVRTLLGDNCSDNLSLVIA
ncbi:MAG: uracil-DNA glycosylase family protein [Bacillota bacterium]